jgi:hypothetical protein
VLIVTAARSDDDPRRDRDSWPPLVDRVTTFQLPLDPLDDASRSSWSTWSPAAGSPPSCDTDLRAGGGNPLFLTELALLALTDEPELPGSLRALIAARLDRLDPMSER